MSQLTSTGGLRKIFLWSDKCHNSPLWEVSENRKFLFGINGHWLCTFSTSQILWNVLLCQREKERNILSYKCCGHDQNKIVCNHKFVTDCQETSVACKNFNHDNNTNFLFEWDGHHKNGIVKFVVVHKINWGIVVSLKKKILSFGGIEKNYYIETINYGKI